MRTKSASYQSVPWDRDETLTKVSRHRGGQLCRNQIPVQCLVISGSCPASAASLTNAWKAMIGRTTMVESSREAAGAGVDTAYLGRLWERLESPRRSLCVHKGRAGQGRTDDVPTGARCFERCACRESKRNTFGRYLHQTGVYGHSTVGKGRTTKAGDEAKLLSPAPPPPGSFSGRPKKKKTHIRAVKRFCNSLAMQCKRTAPSDT